MTRPAWSITRRPCLRGRGEISMRTSRRTRRSESPCGSCRRSRHMPARPPPQYTWHRPDSHLPPRQLSQSARILTVGQLSNAVHIGYLFGIPCLRIATLAILGTRTWIMDRRIIRFYHMLCPPTHAEGRQGWERPLSCFSIGTGSPKSVRVRPTNCTVMVVPRPNPAPPSPRTAKGKNAYGCDRFNVTASLPRPGRSI